MLYRTKIGLTVELYTPFQYFDVWVQEFTKEQIMEIAWTEHVKRLDMEQKTEEASTDCEQSGKDYKQGRGATD